MMQTEARRIFEAHLAPTSPHPLGLHIARAEGVFLEDVSGKKYYDLISGIAVSNVGHRHPLVVEAIRRQVDRYLHVMAYGEFIQDASNALAALLAQLLPPSLNCSYFVNSGTEANEGALKLAKRITGRTQLIACRQSYHGSTHGSLSVSGQEKKKRAFRPLLPDVHFIRFNCEADLAHITARTAAVIIETIQGDAGVRIPEKSYLAALRQRCTDTGAILIFDEIQCGMGRTGTLFAFEQFDVTPDILTVAKAFGGGLPIGAFISRKEYMQLNTFSPMLGHITTFGGNPVCCAAAHAVLQVLTRDNLLAEVEEKGRRFERWLQHPKIKAFRRIGLMMAVDFDTADRVQRIVNRALEKGVICFWFLSHPYSFRLAPPLTISNEETDEACRRLLEAIGES
jgi:acetylornithine/succinyldiaminopimelate/putrescine aminotransferase